MLFRHNPVSQNRLSPENDERAGAGMKENIPAILFHNTVQTGVRAGKILWIRRFLSKFPQTSPKKFLCGWIHVRYKHIPNLAKVRFINITPLSWIHVRCTSHS